MQLLANTGIPMLVFAGVPMLLSLPAVVYVEAKVLRRLLQTPWWRTVGAVAAANAVSTVVGVPVAALVLALIDTLAEPGLVDRYIENASAIFLFASPESDPRGSALAVAALLLLLPFYAASAAIEGYVIALMWKRDDVARVVKMSFRANAVTYALFAVFWFVSLVVNSSSA